MYLNLFLIKDRWFVFSRCIIIMFYWIYVLSFDSSGKYTEFVVYVFFIVLFFDWSDVTVVIVSTELYG